ncbi:RNA dependent RNA polymerase-domain-containing protein [Amylostereum chailletii]|nr:RNA dependent RNA polymerase-domain-containing protein [Amylostereum chailletii]
MRDISFSCTHHDLTRAISDILHKPPFSPLSTLPINFHIYLFKDRRGNRGHSGKGALTLPTVQIGDLFLQYYGERTPGFRHGSSMHPCVVSGRVIKFTLSNKSARQDVVETIKRLPYMDPQAIEDKERRAQELSATSVPVESIQFGWECRDQAFSIEWEHNVHRLAHVSFNDEARELRVRIHRPGEDDIIAIAVRFAHIDLLTAHIYLEHEPAVFFSLNTPPSFEIESVAPGPRKRLSWLPFADHEPLAPYTSRAMRLVLPSEAALNRFRRLGKVAEMHHMSRAECYIVRRNLFSPFARGELETWLASLDWSVSFQIQGILNDLLVDVKEMIALLPRVRTMIRAKGVAYAAAFLKFFRTRLSAWWTSDDFEEVETCEACLDQAVVDYRKQSKAPALTDGHGDVNLFQCLHVIVTPTSIFFEGPFPEQSNRVIRLFDAKNHDSFLRVSFVDEGRVQYRFDRDVDGRHFVRARVGGLLFNGLAIAGKTFQFLGAATLTFDASCPISHPHSLFTIGAQGARGLEVQNAAAGELHGAGRMLEKYGLGSSFRMTSVMTGLAKLGVDYVVGDAFYDTALSFAVNHVLRDLKNHARIPVAGGWTLVGVCDIHGELEHTEIFACVKPLDGRPTVYLEGPVLISRSPTIHPGDVQVVHAIGRPKPGSFFAVERLTNTVVFSAKGPRPIPSYLGGGDLDGDLYNLIPLIDCPEFTPKELFAPASYDPAPKKVLDRASTMVDVAEFIIDYIISDVLGIIAINWLIIADQSSSGIQDKDCLTLSQLHSDAVDYPKSGQPVSIGRIPKLKFKARPDWNAPETVKAINTATHYESQRWIGRLFRAVDLPFVDLKEEATRQRERLRKAHRIRQRDLVDAMREATLSDAGTGLDAEFDPVHIAIETRVSEYIDVEYVPAAAEREALAQVYNRYVSELQSICAANTISHRRAAMLTEEEALVGTIVERTSVPRKRKEKVAKLREMTEHLVRGVREELAGGEEDGWEAALRRAWMAWKLAVKEEGAFGAKSFGWVAIGAIFEAVKEIEEAVNSRR